MNKYEDNLIIELINKDKAINALIPIMCKYSIEPDVQDEIILCLLNIKEDIEEEVKSIFEKATPKKPDFKEVWTPRTLDSLGEPLGCYAYCPNCGNDLYVEAEELPLDEKTKVLNSYCAKCGQALDWSEEDDN